MRRPVEGEVHVHYGQIYVETDPDSFGPGLAEAFAGQRAGLCGAATPGALWLSTGLHTGEVGFTVEVHEQAPPLDPAWEDVVEVSFRPVSEDSALVEWAGEDSWQLDLEETDYRVRYCAKGMDQASERDTRMDGEPQLDRYLLQFWPAPPEPDRVLKQTSRIADRWHRYARELPPPPTPAERAEAERQARLAQETAEREHRLAFERWDWGGRPPSQALREVGGNVRGVLEFDPALVHAIGASGPATQRAVAAFAARRACEAAGLAALDWVADARPSTAAALRRRRPHVADPGHRPAGPGQDRRPGRPAGAPTLPAARDPGRLHAAAPGGGRGRGGPGGSRGDIVGLRLRSVRRCVHHGPTGPVPADVAAAHGPPRGDRRRRTRPAPGGSRRGVRGRRHVRREPPGPPRGRLVRVRGAARVTRP
ncbi:hypothetical protein HDA41_007953 [Streptomyces caelestis]|uniref:Uncharacterized protein n=1 Tax=Streptomyces caelestis TaxID=36816 RepID=A0A7W9HDJ2_9ACTN|nr:hypothetical protein [Streptomyces caelestis]MBB5799989.1 hypothetical protein [Streptomyces caelestis]